MPRNIVLIAYIPKEPDLVLSRKHGQRQRVHGGVTEALIKEAAVLVQMVEVRARSLTSPKVQRADLEIAEELAVVVLASIACIK